MIRESLGTRVTTSFRGFVGQAARDAVARRLEGAGHPGRPAQCHYDQSSCRALVIPATVETGTDRRGQLDKGETMPTIIGHHDVKDTKHWLASTKREEFF